MRSDGGFTAEDWATIYGAGGASPVPSYLSTHYRRARVRSYPSADFAWLLGFAGSVFVLPVLVGLPLAIRAGVKGQPLRLVCRRLERRRPRPLRLALDDRSTLIATWWDRREPRVRAHR